MSFFCQKGAFVIVPLSDVSEEMINNAKISYNSVSGTLRQTLPTATVQKVVINVKDPISPVFNGYPWFNSHTILVEMQKADWQEAEEL